MSLPTFDATFAEVLSLPKKEQLARWLVSVAGSGSVSEYATFPDHYLYAKIAVAYGCARSEADYISLPIVYILNDIYKKLTAPAQEGLIFDDIRSGMGFVLSAIRGDASSSELLGYYVNLPEKYQLALAAVSQLNAVVISGAGTATVNGIYTLSGQENGKNKYILNDNYIAWSGSEWLIYDAVTHGDWCYATSEDTKLPWQATFITTNGDEPAPTLRPVHI